MIKKLYHGTKAYFDEPDLKKAKNRKDFGKGFYLTTNLEQAMKWAIKRLPNNDNRYVAYVYEYEFNTDKTRELNVLELLEYNKEWLDFITPNRHEGEMEIIYDLIYDRMADSTGDELTANIDLYWHKEKSADEVLRAIKFRDGKFDQYCFKTSKAMNCLRRVRYAELYKLDRNPKICKWYKVGEKHE